MLEQDEAIFHALFDNGAHGIVMLGPAFVVERANAQAARLFGDAGGDGLIGQSLLQWAHADDRAMLAERLERVRDGAAGPVEVQCRFVRNDATILRLRASISAARSGASPNRPVVSLVDVTERVEAVLALAAKTSALAVQNSVLEKLDQLGSRLFQARDLHVGLQEILGAAIEIAGADRGNIQLYDRVSGALHILAQRGFDRAFLDAFATVTADGGSACGRALASGERVVVEDVEADPHFSTHRAVMAEAGVRAVQSTPLKRWDGSPLGMLSTHYGVPRTLDASEAAQLDLYSRLAAAFIEHWDEIETLRSGQRSLDLALSASGAGTWSFDAVSGLVTLGPRASGMAGLADTDHRAAVDTLGIDAACCAQARARLDRMRATPGEDEWDFTFGRTVHGEGDGARWLHTHGRAERGSRGELLRINGIVLDISKRRQTEDELLASAAQLRSIIDTAVDSIVVIDEHGIIQAANLAARKTFGYSAEELLGRNVKMLMPPVQRDAHDTYLDNYMRTGIRKIIGIGREVQGVRKNGSLFPIDLAVAEWRDGSGRRFFTGILRDITQRKLHEQALATAQRLEAVGQLASGVSHDLNNLLAVISGNLELAEGEIQDVVARTAIRRALDAVQVGSSFNRRLLSLSRRRPVAAQVVDINARVEETAQVLARTMGERIQLDVSLGTGLWHTSADPGEVDSALLNLAINARDAMPNGGRLSVATANVTLGAGTLADFPPGVRAGDYAVVTVGDDGEGMTRETLERATEPFFSTKEPGKGTGLGLSTISTYLGHIGGFLTIDSEPGKGCSVRLYFPRSLDRPPEDHGAARGDLPRGDGELVLVVEDDDDVRDVVVRQIRAIGYAVEEARSGAEAVEWLESTQLAVRVVVSDVVMPGTFSGYDLVRWLAANRPQVAAVLSSGYNDGDCGERDGEPADVAILAKPYTREQLARAIRAPLLALAAADP